MESWQTHIPKAGIDIGPGVAYSFGRCQDILHLTHTKECIWIWHDCDQVLGEGTVAPGARFGWRPSGIDGHTLESIDPLTVSPSVYWPECCGKHGFITMGRYYDV